MGRILQRTAISTNIKERLDFSCALFGPDGGLVSNAPHIPVHLGAMQETVQFQVHCPPTIPSPASPSPLHLPPGFQIKHLGADLHPGDVLLSNHPSAGGSHLPDLTVITPVRGIAWVLFGRGSKAADIADHWFLPTRCFGQLRHGLCSMWPAEGTTRTLGALPQAPCLPTPPHFNRRVLSFCHLSWSKGVSSRSRVSKNGTMVGV